MNESHAHSETVLIKMTLPTRLGIYINRRAREAKSNLFFIPIIDKVEC